MSDLLKQALAISQNRRALEMITAAQGGVISRKKMTLRVRMELARFIRAAPLDPADRERYTTREKLYGCIRIVRRGKASLRRQAIQEGLVIAGHTLTGAYIGARYGWLQPVVNKNGGRRGKYKSGTTDGALAAMVEASRVLRRDWVF